MVLRNVTWHEVGKWLSLLGLVALSLLTNKNQQEVYAGELWHRSAQDARTIGPIDAAFEPLARSWVMRESQKEASTGSACTSCVKELQLA